MRRSTLVAGVLLFAPALVGGMLWSFVGFHAHPAAAQSQQLDGTWMEDFQTARGRVVAVKTFTTDGSEFVTNSEHPVRSPLLGRWEQTGDRQFATTEYRFIFDSNGTYVQMQKQRSQITLNDALDEYTLQSFQEFYDPDGNFLSTGSGSAQGRRLTVELMP